MEAIHERDEARYRQLFAGMQQRVRLLLFVDSLGCVYCAAAQQIVEALGRFGDMLDVEIADIGAEAERAAGYGVKLTPGLVLLGETDPGVRFFGVPGGYERDILVDDIGDLGRGSTELHPATAAPLALLDRPVHLQVYVSPTCPFCAAAVRAAHKLALASDFVRADMIDVTQFPHLVEELGIRSVPHTIIDGTVHVPGAIPEPALMKKILAAG